MCVSAGFLTKTSWKAKHRNRMAYPCPLPCGFPCMPVLHGADGFHGVPLDCVLTWVRAWCGCVCALLSGMRGGLPFVELPCIRQIVCARRDEKACVDVPLLLSHRPTQSCTTAVTTAATPLPAALRTGRRSQGAGRWRWPRWRPGSVTSEHTCMCLDHMARQLPRSCRTPCNPFI